jgi:hypothetical protein
MLFNTIHNVLTRRKVRGGEIAGGRSAENAQGQETAYWSFQKP